jgi:TolA-binding protein
VGGVRGSLADAGELYWKGETSEQAIDAEELAAFDEALSYAEVGDMAVAEKGLAAFINNYPKSQLRADAEQALALVRGQLGASK